MPGKYIGKSPTALAKVTSQAEYDALPFGSAYTDAAGATFTKSWVAKDQASYDAIPDGAEYVTPGGERLTKAKAENIGLGAQTLYDMAWNDQTKRNILEKEYPGAQVHRDKEGFYAVTSEGKKYRPSVDNSAMGWTKRAVAEAGALAAPVAGSVAGAVGGLTGGPVGALGGAGLGMAGGAAFNDVVLREMGVLSADRGEEALHLAGQAALGTVAQGVGGIAGRVVGTVPALFSVGQESGFAAGVKTVAKELAPKALVRSFLGYGPEQAAKLGHLVEKGIPVPPKESMPSSPFINLLYRLSTMFGEDPVAKGAEKYFGETVREMLTKRGLPTAEIDRVLVDLKKAAPDFAPAGTALHKEYHGALVEADKVRAAKFASLEEAAKKSAAEGSVSAQVAHLKAVEDAKAAALRSQEALDDYVNSGFKFLGNTADLLRAKMPPEVGPGDFYKAIGGMLKGRREEVGKQYAALYSDVFKLAGDAQIPMGLPRSAAQKVVEALPPEMQGAVPAVVRSAARMGTEDVGGVAVEAPLAMTLEEAQSLRSWLRSAADWQTLSSDVRNGSMKMLADSVNRAIHAPNLPPQVRSAVEALDKVDAGYRTHVVPFGHPAIQGVMDDMAKGLAPDAAKLADAMMVQHSDEVRAFMRASVGDNAWDAMLGAHLQTMLKNSETSFPGVYDAGKFLSQFLETQRTGLLKEYPGGVSIAMREQAQRIEAMADKGKGIMFRASRDDTLKSLMEKAAKTADDVKAIAKTKPVDTLAAELKRLREAQAAENAAVQEGRKSDLLFRLLGKSDILAHETAREIWRRPDFFKAALSRFSEDSEGLQLLRNAATQDFFSLGTVEKAGGLRKAWGELLPEQQEFMAAGLGRDEVARFLSDMEILLGDAASDFGASLMGTAAVTHPAGAPILGKGVKWLSQMLGPAKAIIPVDTVGRFFESVVFPKIAQTVSDPRLFRWLASDATPTPARDRVLKILMDHARYGNVALATTAPGARLFEGDAGLEEKARGDWRQEVPATSAPRGGWRDALRAGGAR